MGRYRRRVAAAVVLGGLLVLALAMARASGPHTASIGGAAAHAAQHEPLGRPRAKAARTPRRTATARTRRRRSRSTRSRARSRRTRSSSARARSSSRRWDFLGPETLDVDRLGTQSFIKPTQWSGRVTALAVDPKCKPQECTLYVGAAGGGVWRSKNALAPKPDVEADLGGDPDERDRLDRRRPQRPEGQDDLRRHRRGERERRQRGRARPLQDDRRRRALVARPGLVRGREPPRDHLGRDRAGQCEPHPDRDAHRRARDRLELHEHGHRRGAVAGAGVYDSTDGGATFALTQAGSINEVKFDPSDPSVRLRDATATGGLLRSTPAARPAPGSRSSRRTGAASRSRRCAAERQDAHLPGRLERRRPGCAGLPDRRREPAGGDVDRLEQRGVDAPVEPDRRHARHSVSTTTATAARRLAVLLRHVDPLAARPARHGGRRRAHALRGAEAVRHQVSPVVGMRSNGRAVMMSMDKGATWTDMTGRRRRRVDAPGPARTRVRAGQPGPVLRRIRRRPHPHERQVGRRVRPVRRPRPRRAQPRIGVQAVAEPHPEEAGSDERGPRRPADVQHLRQPVLAGRHGDDGHAGQRDAVLHGLDGGTCRSPATAATAASTRSTLTSASTPTPEGRWT